MLYIVQIKVQHKILMANNFVSDVWSVPKLKIHPVEAETGQKAIEKLTAHYKKIKPEWRVIVVDTEELIS